MATKYPKFLLSTAIAQSGDVTIPPESPDEAGLGRLSQSQGWGAQNAIPLEQGGIPPYRDDFNGAFFLLSQLILWYQQGGIMNYSATLDYEIGNEVLQNGVKYRCIAPNGPSSTTVAPGSNSKIWRNIDTTVPAGAVMPFSNVTLGGSDGRRPIFWGNIQADEGWVICDGGSDGRGGTTPNLIDRFIKGSSIANSGTTGGSAVLNIPNIVVNGTIGGTALTIAQLPAHNHSADTNQTGEHTHTRGNMNITGQFGCDDRATRLVNGCFSSFRQSSQNTSASGGDSEWWGIQMDASRSWTGNTSGNGKHQHTVTVGNTGSGQPHSHTLTANTSISGVSNEPPFFCMAYFIKLPE